jgi:hypothetical protein
MFKLLLLSADLPTVALLRAATDALKGTVDPFTDPADIGRRLVAPPDGVPIAVALDLSQLAAYGQSLASICTLIRRILPTAPVVAIAPKLPLADAATAQWAKQSGATDIVSQITPWRWVETGEKLLRVVTDDDVSVAAATRRVAPYLRVAMHNSATSPARMIAAAESNGIALPALAARMQRSGGVKITDRRYRLQVYPECFVASEAVRWLEGALRLPTPAAASVGEALQAAGLIYHVAHEQTFADENYYFRVSQWPARWDIERFYSVARGSTGLEVADRQYMGATYPKCFVGADAVRWMQTQGHTLNEAICMGQRLLDLSIIHHVVDAHCFKNEKLFYRFYADE